MPYEGDRGPTHSSLDVSEPRKLDTFTTALDGRLKLETSGSMANLLQLSDRGPWGPRRVGRCRTSGATPSGRVGEEELRVILAGNAAKLYDFDLDALAPLAEKYGPTVAEVAEPLGALPENPNSALLKGAGVAVL